MAPSTVSSVRASLTEAAQVLGAFLTDESCLTSVERFADLAWQTLERGGRLYSCGNGGSTCDAMHFAEEWTGRFRKDRRALPATALADPSQITCIANDYGFDEVFKRQVEAHGREGDLLLAISTSGSSENVVRAVQAAKRQGMVTVGLLGQGGGRLRPLVDHAVIVPDARTTDRIQEMHIKVIHVVIEAVERRLFPEAY